MITANRDSAAKIIPVGRRRAWREDLAEHRDLFIGIKNLAQYVGAGSLSADHHEKLNATGRGIGIQSLVALRSDTSHAELAPTISLSTALRLFSQADQNWAESLAVRSVASERSHRYASRVSGGRLRSSSKSDALK